MKLFGVISFFYYIFAVSKMKKEIKDILIIKQLIIVYLNELSIKPSTTIIHLKDV